MILKHFNLVFIHSLPLFFGSFDVLSAFDNGVVLSVTVFTMFTIYRISHLIRAENVKIVCRFLLGRILSIWKDLCRKHHRVSFSIVLESTSLQCHPHLTKHARTSPLPEQSLLFSPRIGRSLSIVLHNNKRIRSQNPMLKES